MTVSVNPGKLCGTVRAIPSKSVAHRIILAAAMSKQPTHIMLSQLSKDISASLSCAKALGADIAFDSNGVTITPFARHVTNPLLDCNESGTTLRLFLPCVAASFSSAEFSGKGRLMQRPLSPLKEELEKHGIRLNTVGGANLNISGRLTSGDYYLPGNVSSQFISGLLFALPLLCGNSKIIITSELESAGYVDMTLDTLEQFGIKITKEDYGYFVKGSQEYRSPGNITVEGDWSNAAFWFCAGALGSNISVEGLCTDSLQGDKAVLDVLQQMGATVNTHENKISVQSCERLSSVTVNGSQIPDLIPILAATACFAKGDTLFTDIGRLKLKESDRIQTICNMINSCGGKAVCGDDFIKITGKDCIHGGTADSCNDHRISMSLAIMGTASQNGITITDASAVQKSYTDFYEDIISLGGILNVINN